MSETYLLIDGHSLIYRAHHAMKHAGLRTQGGEPVWAVFGFARMLINLIDNEDPDGLACTMDTAGPTFRSDIRDDYKAQRPDMPDELQPQISRIAELFEALEIPVYSHEDYESDDLLATIATDLCDNGYDGTIGLVTNDKDCFQMVNDNIHIYKNKKGVSEIEVLDEQAVIDKTGVKPDRIAEWLALTGDQSDNIPGVPGIGPAYASRALDAFGSFDDLFSSPERLIDVLSENKQEKIYENEEQVREALSMTQLRSDVDIDFELDDIKFSGIDNHRDQLINFCKKYDFNSLVDELKTDDLVSAWDELPSNTNKISFKELNNKLKTDTQKVIFISATPTRIRKQEEVEVWLNIDDTTYQTIVNDAMSKQQIKQFKTNINSNTTVTYHSKRVQSLLNKKTNQVISDPDYFDLKLASYLLNPGKDHDLETLLQRFLNLNPDDDPHKSPTKVVSVFGKLYETITNQLDNKRRDLLYEIDQPLSGMLAAMEARGIVLDKKRLNELLDDVTEKCKEYKEKINKAAGEGLNPRSPKQLRRILFDKLDLPVQGKTSTGKPSTDADTLEALRDKHELPDLILTYRQYQKIKGTYLEPLLEHCESDGRIHTELPQTVAATGRLSSQNPNLQNIPVHNEYGKQVREAFVAPDSRLLLSVDYSQVEMRILAHLAQDERLIDIFKSGRDIHTETASELFKMKSAEVEEKNRRIAKVVNYGIAYGLSAYGLARDLDINQSEAQDYIDRYFKRFPDVKNFIDRTIDKAKDQGYVETAYGRKRQIPELKSSNYQQRQFGERAAINTPIQGYAADLLKEDMLKLREPLRSLQADTLLQIHDELIFYITPDEEKEVRELLQSIMGADHDLRVPIEVDIASGKRWADVSK